MTPKNGLTSLLVLGFLGSTVAFSSGRSFAGEHGAEEARIEQRLKKETDLKDVHVKCDRIVTLTGKVGSESEKVRAERLANLPGVTRVDNQIEVTDAKAKEKIEDRADASKEAIQRRADAEKERVDRAAEAKKERVDQKHEGKTTVGDDVTDSWITTKLKTQYTTEGAFKHASIHVDTDDKGVVTLRGTVPSETSRAKAVEVARGTKGVRSVNDQLEIATPN